MAERQEYNGAIVEKNNQHRWDVKKSQESGGKGLIDSIKIRINDGYFLLF